MVRVNNERGTVMVFITAMIVLLMVMVGMGLDTGQLGFTRTTGQGAVDAAALSAVSALPLRDLDKINLRAKVFNDENTFTNSADSTISDSSVTLIEYNWDSGAITAAASITTANGVRVAMESKNPYNAGATNTPVKSPLFLTPLFNLFGQTSAKTANVSVSAVAVATTIPTIPIVLWSNMCGATDEKRTDVQIKMQHPDKKDDEGSENACWTTFFDCSSGAADIKALFQAGQTCTGAATQGVQLGSEICQNRGQVATTLKTAEDFFLKDNEQGWWLVPVISGGGNCDPNNPAKVTNWAKIYPTEVKDSGKDKYIKADIVCNPNLPKTIMDANLCFSNRLVRDTKSGM